MNPDPFADLAQLPGVAESVAEVRTAVDAVLWPRHLGSDGPQLSVASRVHGAQASAAIDGIDFAVEAWWSGDAWEDSPMGRIAAGVWRGYRELPTLVEVWRRAPLQALARLHAVVAKGLGDDADVGRPRTSEDVDDPLRLGSAADPSILGPRLSLLGTLVGTGTSAPAVVEAAAVHAEIATLQPFRHGSGQVARMASRLVLAARGLDPDQLIVPEVGIMQLGRPRYVAALRNYRTGSAEGVGEWLNYYAATLIAGAAAADQILSGIRSNGVGNGASE
ncbi:MAG: Fic family protein [Actinobacteria bacterium]|nr:Fic family protein [Actinomycetota bacterium]